MKSRLLKTVGPVGLAATMFLSTGCFVIVDGDDESNTKRKKVNDPNNTTNNTQPDPCDAAKTSDGTCDMTCKSVDPDCVEPTKTCGDGSQLACRQAEPTCADGLVVEIVNGCYGDCVDPNTCQAPKGCGGIAGTQCDAGSTCQDDPSDSCDPNNGGTDCAGICVKDETKSCGDGSQLMCRRVAPECPAGSEAEIVNGCYSDRCVDPATCNPVERMCNAAQALCERIEPTCPEGSVAEVDAQTSCYTDRCLSVYTCQAIDPTKPCHDDSQVICDAEPPECPEGLVAELKNGCWGACVDPATCKAPPACGGKTGELCEAGYTCIDDPNDGCDPNNGGADCGGICVKQTTKACGDGTQLMCRQKAPECPAGLVVEIVNSCYGDCVDPATCKVPDTKCGDGTSLTCKRLAPECEPGYKPEIVNSCYGRCVNSLTCEPYRCGDGSTLTCRRAEPACPAGTIAEIVNGCYGRCVDESSCQAPAMCGGIAGTRCAQGLTCVDDPSDSCDPNNGGADCSGICVKDDKKSCGDGSQLMCRRVAPDCPAGTDAEIVNGCYSDRCVEPATCKAQPRVCSLDGTQLRCLAPAPACAKGTTPQINQGCYTGKCVDQYSCKTPTSCGGFVGAICAANETCEDVPNDGCDPNNGGADCIGVCVGQP